jgi:ribosome maturation factor RimP
MSFEHFRKLFSRLFATTRTSPHYRTVLEVETFEARVVPAGLTASFSLAGILHVEGTEGNDRIALHETHGRISLGGTMIHAHGRMVAAVNAARVKEIDIDGVAGNDRINVASAGKGMQPITSHVIINAGTGHDTVFSSHGEDVTEESDSGEDDDSQGDQGEESTSTEGTVTAVDTTASTVTLTTEDGQTKTFTIPTTATIEVNGTTATLSAVQVGMHAEVTLDSMGNVTSLEAKTASEESTSAEGTVTAVDTTAMTVTLTTEDGPSKTFTIPTTATIEVNGMSSTLSAVQVGMHAEVTLDSMGNVVKLVAKSASEETTSAEGTVTAVDTTASTVTLTTEDGPSKTFTIPTTATIEVNGMSATLSAVQVGMHARVTLDSMGNVVNLEAKTPENDD